VQLSGKFSDITMMLILLVMLRGPLGSNQLLVSSRDEKNLARRYLTGSSSQYTSPESSIEYCII